MLEAEEEKSSSPELFDSTEPSTEPSINYEPINPGDQSTLLELARSLSGPPQTPKSSRAFTRTFSRVTSRKQTTADDLVFQDERTDPYNTAFDLQHYLKKFLTSLQTTDIELKQSDVTMRNVNISGSGSALTLQPSMTDIAAAPFRLRNLFAHQDHKRILRDVNLHLQHGELLVVLGRPGAGCSTLLKAMTGELHGLVLDKDSHISYSGIPQNKMIREFKGEAIYNQEVDKHFPHLTVGQTLEHAAALRAPRTFPGDMSRSEFVKHITQVVMAVYGLSHTYNTKVGDDFIRGVSGGERKRVSIAEMALANSPISAWDNSTRGLDSAAALKFVKSLRLTSNLLSTTSAVAIYQASQAIYDLFDKATVLYEGRQIYFGPAKDAKAYFEAMGWECPERQTTGDFITSVTNPSERTARKGFENKVPRTPDEFEAYWKNSQEYATLMKQLEASSADGTSNLNSLRTIKNSSYQAKHARRKSPYAASISMQIRCNLKRAVQRVIGDKPSTVAPIFTNIVMALVIGSVFYNTAQGTQGFNSFGAALFFAILLNALGAIAEIANLYAQRPIVEKHKSYAFYHPFTEALAGVVLDIPIKFVVTTCFSLILYFLAHLRREPAQFFLFLMVNYITTFIMTAVFRAMAALTKTVSQAMALAGVLVLAIINYTGYSLPIPYMHPWFSWIRYINPVQYGFEMLVANQFHGIDWTCSAIVPAYSPNVGDSWICNVPGAVPGQYTVNGDVFIQSLYGYSYSHFWRNFGILWAFLIGFMAF